MRELPSPDARALATCGLAILQAQDGRGRWRPVKRCVDSLVASGCRPAMALQMAAAMVAVAEAVRDVHGQAGRVAAGGA